MVEYSSHLDLVFGSLADPTRRDILRRVTDGELSVSEIALPYSLSLAAVAKHISVLERANLIIKQRRGKQQFVLLSPAALQEARSYLSWYENHLAIRLDGLENYINKEIE